jgi:hypothetical protein
MRERLRGALGVPRLRIFAGSSRLSRLITGLFIGIVIVSMLATMTSTFAVRLHKGRKPRLHPKRLPRRRSPAATGPRARRAKP